MSEPLTPGEQMRRTAVIAVMVVAMVGLTAGVANAGNSHDKEVTTTTTTVMDTTTTVLATTTTFDLSDCPSGDESDCAKSVLKCSDLDTATAEQIAAILRDNNQCPAPFCVDGKDVMLPYGIDVLEAKTFTKGKCPTAASTPTTKPSIAPRPVPVNPKYTG